MERLGLNVRVARVIERFVNGKPKKSRVFSSKNSGSKSQVLPEESVLGREDGVLEEILQTGEIPNPFEEPQKEKFSFEVEIDKQIDDRIGRKFHEELNLLQDEYRKSILESVSMSESFFEESKDDYFPVLVDPRVDLTRQLKIAGITKNFEGEISNWEGDFGHFKTPDSPYIVFVRKINDSNSLLTRSALGIRKKLSENQRGATVLEGVSISFSDSKVLDSYELGLIGSQVGSRVPRLFRQNNGNLLMKTSPENYTSLVYQPVICFR